MRRVLVRGDHDLDPYQFRQRADGAFGRQGPAGRIRAIADGELEGAFGGGLGLRGSFDGAGDAVVITRECPCAVATRSGVDRIDPFVPRGSGGRPKLESEAVMCGTHGLEIRGFGFLPPRGPTASQLTG